MPIAFTGLVYMILISPWLLPDRKSTTNAYLSHLREYTMTVALQDGSVLLGKTPQTAGFDKLEGLYLLSIQVSHNTSPLHPFHNLAHA